MLYQEFPPSPALSKFVECYFTCEQVDDAIVEDNIYASGAIEIMFSLREDRLQKIINGMTVNEPSAQLWGQTIRPLQFKGGGRHSMLGVRFFSHAAACFFGENMAQFNDRMVDFEAVKGIEGKQLYRRLVETELVSRKLDLLNEYLASELSRFQKTTPKAEIIKSLFCDLRQNDLLRNISSLARSYGMSSRYLQKVCTHCSGLSPALYFKIERFRKSIRLIAAKDRSLTAIAYQSGYYDQPHFIRDFRYFTGMAPSRFQAESSTDLFVPMNR